MHGLNDYAIFKADIFWQVVIMLPAFLARETKENDLKYSICKKQGW